MHAQNDARTTPAARPLPAPPAGPNLGPGDPADEPSFAKRYHREKLRRMHLAAVANGACPGCGLHTRHAPGCDEARRDLQPSEATRYEPEPLPWGPTDADLAEYETWLAEVNARLDVEEAERRESELDAIDDAEHVPADDDDATWEFPR